MFNPDIYRSYDIRGIVPDEFDPEEAYHIGRAYAEFTNPRNVVVARDMRTTGEEMLAQLIRGLTDGGVDVVNIGMSTTPMFYFAIHKLETDGGLIVTASHNPGKYNGIKMTRQQAIPIGGETGLFSIRDLVEKRDWKNPASAQGYGGRSKKAQGTVSEENVQEAYLDMVTAGVSAEGLKIVVDAGNGMTGLLLKDYFARVGGEVVPMYWELDGTFPNHEADPLKEENTKDLQQRVKEEGADLGVAFDGDGDRAFFITEQGERVPGDISTALIAQEVLKEQPGSLILYNVSASRATKEAIEEAGGKAQMTKVGHSNIKAHMRSDNAVFAGETSGHFFFTPWFAESSFLALGYVLRLMQEQKKPLSELVQPLLRYAKTSEINFEVEDKESAMQRIKERYSDAEILELDGISVMYPEWWANVRASNTEPLLRLNMEADTPELLAEKRKEIENLITA